MDTDCIIMGDLQGICKRMLSQQRGERSFHEDKQVVKIHKSITKKKSNIGIQKMNLASQLRELTRALRQGKVNSRVLALVCEIIKIPNLPTNEITLLLKLCVNIDSVCIVFRLLNSNAINLKTPEGGELLWYAMEKDQMSIAKMLLRFGADLNVRKSDDNRTLLHAILRGYAIKSNNKREQFALLMMDHGADVNACDAHGYSILHDAIVHQHCSTRLVEQLLDRGARLTIDKSCNDRNDIFLATCYKPELLLRLIEHQIEDVETRNQRGTMAMDYLISKEYNDPDTIGPLQLIRRILTLGVPVDTVDPFAEQRVGRQPCPLLSTALFHKKKRVIKLLLDHGADPHEKDELGRTPLFQATAFKWHTQASRWLIEKGANIHARNDDGRYPIHGACSAESLRTIHLFLNLDADLNVTDNEGCTPFSLTQDTYNFNEAHCLIIKHLALTIAKGGGISDEDMTKINQSRNSRRHFKNCTKQLERMKRKIVCAGVSYFSLFSNNMSEMIQLMGNRYFVRGFRENEEMRDRLFSNYSYMLLHVFEIAEKRYKIFRTKKRQIEKVFESVVLPDCVIEKITYYLCFDKLVSCQCDYYISLHTTLENTKADKAKIL